MVTWTREQQEAIERKDSNILVAAAAGSGKTAVLVERIIQKLLEIDDPLHIDEILVATFTNAAAEEMRSRVGAALETAITDDPTSTHLKKQLSLLQRASISTLHAFCTTVVRQYAYLLDVDPAFRIADEMEIDLIKQEVIDEMFEEAYGKEGDQLDCFFTVVDMFSNDRSDIDVEQLILKLYTFSVQNPWPEEWLKQVADSYLLPEDCAEEDLPWLTMLKEEMKDQLQSFRFDTERAIKIAYESDGPYQYVDALESDLIIIDEALQRVHSWDELQQFITTSKLKKLSRKRVECNEDKKDRVQKIRGRFRDQWNKMNKSWFSRNLTAHMEDMRELYPVMKQVTELVIDFKRRYAAVKKEKALLDFSDLEHFCLAVLIEPTSTIEKIVPSDIAHYFKSQFKEVLVDEYQDINLVQETILSVVSDDTEGGNMFMVGDVKQSIYGFRHAEPTLFIDKYKQFAQDKTVGRRIDLAKNFRSREDVLTGANYIFKQVFDETIGEIAYDTSAELVYGNLSYEEHSMEQPETELLIIDRDSEENEERVEHGENVEDLETTQLEARLYARKIKEWIGKTGEQPAQVIDKATNKKRDITYKDIVILQRSLTGAPTIVDELKKQGIPVYAELRTGYFVAIEIQVMINMLKIIDNPYQDIPLASVLRSPIVGLNEEQLATIRLAKQHASFYEALKEYKKGNEEASNTVHYFLEQLESFRQLVKEGALSELIWQIYRDTGYYDFVGGIPGGRQRQANLRALYDRARGYESTSFRGLFRFLRFIERMQEQNKDLGEARALSEQEDVVRIMTIHKSKGLEFPYVIIGGMNKQFNFQDLRSKYILDKDFGFASKFIDPVKRITYPTLYYLAVQQESLRKLLAEEMRVLYVAMTRAKEKLVMIGNVPSFEKSQENWMQVADYSDWMLPKQMRKEAKTYLDWVAPALIRHVDNTSLRGGEISLHIPDDIWNDKSRWQVETISATRLTNIDEQEQVTKEELKSTIVGWNDTPNVNEELRAEVADRLSFAYNFQEAAETRAKQSVTEIKRRQEVADEYSSQQLITPYRAPLVKRPNFMQEEKALTATEIGTAMHAVMQHLPLTKQHTRKELTEYVARFVREEKLTKQEAEVIDLEAVEAFFASDIAALMVQSERIEREVPFTYTIDVDEIYPEWRSETNEKVLIQGVMDCIIYTEDGAIILDYKTDAITDDVLTDEVITTLKKRYETQLTLYKRALEDILQERVKETYLYFFAKDLVVKID